MNINKKEKRINMINVNYQGCLMKIIEYKTVKNIVVEFQDDFHAKVNTEYQHFIKGNVKNPYYPSVYDVGISGNKYPIWTSNKNTKEYEAWKGVLRRCYDKNLKEKYPTYKDVACCEEWLLYENFYEWLHNQENFKPWLNGDKWEVDKDILVKGNKIYSPETCCLVPHNINCLFTKNDKLRGNLPIGINKTARGKGYQVRCGNPITGQRDYLGYYQEFEDGFLKYKEYKEYIIKQVAELEYSQGNITKQCYEAMLNYEVEITD